MRLLLVMAVLACGSVSASAQSIESAYTTFDADKTCKHTPSKEPEDYGEWLCPGYGNIPVRLAAGDQRMLISFGKKPKNDDDDLASSQTFAAFNDAYKGTIEWRLEKSANGKLRPFATILRWNVMVASDHTGQRGGTKATGRALVVTRLGPGGVCHVGYVDARANPDANDLARKLADEHARTFKCGKDKRIVVGKSGDVGMPRDD